MGAVAERDADVSSLFPPTTSCATSSSGRAEGQPMGVPSVDDAIGVQLPR